MFALQGKIKISRVVALWAFLCALVLATQPACFAGKQVPFVASYKNNIEADFSSFPLVAVTSKGSVLATHLGKASARSISETVNLGTGEGVAVHEFTAANGDRILINFHFLAIPTSETQFSIEGVWTITGGTGLFAGATGEGSYQGVAQFTSPTTALGEFEMIGSISSVGSLR